MGYEIDFLAVGEESHSGDAIAMRCGNLNGSRQEQTIIVIDGGFKDSGEKLVNWIRKYYNDPEYIDIVVSTHPDQDHISGLDVVLDEFQVNLLLMHQPWEHNVKRATSNVDEDKLRATMDSAKSLFDKAHQKDVKVQEPFVGLGGPIIGGVLEVVGPTKEYYQSLLPDFSRAAQSMSGLQQLVAKVGERVHMVQEFWGKETLKDDGETSATNNSSVILQISVDNRRLLFTGDAGIPALEKAADYLEAGGNPREDLRVIQIPHHGSHRNSGPSVLNRIIGPIVEEDEQLPIIAVASCAKEGEPKHPSKRVLNAFKRRGVGCYLTQGRNFWESHDAPNREGFKTVEPCPFYNEVEE